MSKLYFKIAINTPAHNWSENLLQNLTILELKCLKKIMGFRCGSGKERIISYLLSASKIRYELYKYWQHWETWENLDWDTQKEIIQNLSNNYKSKDLKKTCKTVRTFAPSTKYGMAASLINWAINCNRASHKFIADQKSIITTRPKQLNLFTIVQHE